MERNCTIAILGRRLLRIFFKFKIKINKVFWLRITLFDPISKMAVS